MSIQQGSREITTFPIPPALLAKLCDSGFIVVEDLSNLKPSELSHEAKIPPSDALEVLQTVFENHNASHRKPSVPPPKTAWELFQEEEETSSIVTFSEQLDEMIGGGIPLAKITEFCGAPGVGKTQLCLQLAVDVQIPEDLGGLAGEVVYIDTEGSFMVERLNDIASATVEHCQAVTQNTPVDLKDFTVDKILSGVHYYRCSDHIELLAIIHLLPAFFKDHPKIRLVIVDSIASPFRQNFDDMSARTRILSSLAQNFIKMAMLHKTAVVLTNQMTTKVVQGAGNSHLIPALGESWGHASTIRVILYWENNQRRAMLFKSPINKEQTCSYQITLAGIRDVISSHDSTNHTEDTSTKMSVSANDEEIAAKLNPDENYTQPLKKQRVT